MLRFIKLIKSILILLPLTLILYPFSRMFLFIIYFNKLILWIYKHKSGLVYSDFFSWKRDYTKRYRLYAEMVKHFNLAEEPLTYFEFGVASGASLKWWQDANKNEASRFFGFDTFTGLPESWGGFYLQGDMKHDVPVTSDKRVEYVKGLFQDTLNRFIDNQKEFLLLPRRKLIHLDADLYSASIFTLSQLYPYIKKGDIILFDEFNVPLHEFKAYLEFTGAFYKKLKPVAAVNNFYQTAFVAE